MVWGLWLQFWTMTVMSSALATKYVKMAKYKPNTTKPGSIKSNRGGGVRKAPQHLWNSSDHNYCCLLFFRYFGVRNCESTKKKNKNKQINGRWPQKFWCDNLAHFISTNYIMIGGSRNSTFSACMFELFKWIQKLLAKWGIDNCTQRKYWIRMCQNSICDFHIFNPDFPWKESNYAERFRWLKKREKTQYDIEN